jgi:precorrin-6Y C5,15-methyltransferase (decarboxylating)
MTAPIAVVGLGIGAPQLAPQAAAAVARAELLVGGARQLAALADHPAERLPIAGPLSPVLDAVARAVDQGRAVAVLADGDPLHFGIGRALLERFGPGRLTFFPNVTAVAAAAARLGRPWQDLPVVSLHGRNDYGPLFAALARHGQAAVLTDAGNTPAAIAAAVAERAGDRFALTVLEELGLPGERVRRLGLEQAVAATFSPLNVVILEATRPPEVVPGLGLADDALLRPDAVYTKAVPRAVALAALAPRPGDVVFDVGAGVGTVAIEAATLNAGGPVFAVERDPGRHALLVRNIRRTGALTVVPVLGQAPEVLAGLPDPDRVFVGGGLSAGPALLDHLAARLRPGGRLVVAAVLLGSIEAARTALARPEMTLSLVQVQASRAAPLAGDWHLRADNPVCVLTAVKEASP